MVKWSNVKLCTYKRIKCYKMFVIRSQIEVQAIYRSPAIQN